jgi:sugar phosphate isomerase/epimerase
VPFCSAAEVAEVKRIALGEGIEITALSPGLFKHAQTNVDRISEMKEKLPNTFDLAVELRISIVLTFSFQKCVDPHEGDLEEIALWLRDAAQLADAAGIRLLVEPEPVCRVDTGLAAKKVIAMAASPALGLNYDPCNVAWQLGVDPSFEMESISPLIEHLHIKDMTAGCAPEPANWVMIGDGMVNYRSIFRQLHAAKYRGELCLEPHIASMDATTLSTYSNRVKALWAEAEELTYLEKTGDATSWQ